MPIVDARIPIVGVPLATVWETLVDFDSYPSYMDEVLSARYLCRDAQSAESDWAVLLNGSELRWRERDTFDPMKRIAFEQIDGDIEIWAGFWEIIEGVDGLDVRLFVEFDIGIPSLSSVLNPIGARAIKANCRQMLSHLQARSTSAARTAAA